MLYMTRDEYGAWVHLYSGIYFLVGKPKEVA